MFKALTRSAAVFGTASIDSSHVKAHRSAGGGKHMARPVGKWFLQLPKTVCTNVSGLSAMPLTKMEIRAFCSS